MGKNDIHVVQAESGSWLVTEGCWLHPFRVFRLKSNAMAFAFAVAGSRGVAMRVHGPDGSQTRTVRGSPTYKQCRPLRSGYERETSRRLEPTQAG